MEKGRQRSGKFYFRNEEEVMKELGLTPTKGSGSGWLEKEDGYNDYIIAQLKSTDKKSMGIKKFDLEKLEYNATVSKKIPMFIIQFLSDNSRYALVNIDDIPDIAKYIETGHVEISDEEYIEVEPKVEKPKRPKIKSNAKAREQFYKQKEKAWEEKRWKKS